MRVAPEVTLVTRPSAQYVRDVAGDARLLGDNKDGHGGRSVETTTLLSYQKAGVTVGTAKKSIAIVLFALKPDLATVDHRESVL